MYTIPLLAMRGRKGKAGACITETYCTRCCWVVLTVVGCHHAALATSLGMEIVILLGEFGVN